MVRMMRFAVWRMSSLSVSAHKVLRMRAASRLSPVADIAVFVQDAKAFLPAARIFALLLEPEEADVRATLVLVFGDGDGIAADSPGSVAAEAVGGRLDEVPRHAAAVADSTAAGVSPALVERVLDEGMPA